MVSKIKKFFLNRKFYKTKDNVSYEARMQKKMKPYIRLKNAVDKDKKKLTQDRNKVMLPSQSKILLLILFVNFFLIEGFIIYVTIKSFTVALSINLPPDFTPLVTLISVVAGETISYGIYASKAKAENTVGGIVYDMRTRDLEQYRNNDGTFG